MLKIIDSDIFESGADIIAHQVNCQGVMGSGVAKQVREKFPYVYKQYQTLCDCVDNDASILLGCCFICEASEGAITGSVKAIANLFGQNDYGYDGKCYTNYGKLRAALASLREQSCGFSELCGRKVKIAIPYLMGCHRGGGDWEIVSKMIEEELTDCDVTLYRYTGG